MTKEEKKDIIQNYISSYNNFDIDGMVVFVHPEVVFKNVTSGEVNTKTEGIDQFREIAMHSKALFLSRQQKATSFKFVGDIVTVDIHYNV